eukprot:3582296-Alexandrium_andersonii.AAC.1
MGPCRRSRRRRRRERAVVALRVVRAHVHRVGAVEGPGELAIGPRCRPLARRRYWEAHDGEEVARDEPAPPRAGPHDAV